MDYITISEMAEKWNISERMIRRYCIDGRIEGTIFEDNAWLIPEDAQKPLRKKKEAPELPILVKKLQRQRTKKIYHGLYDYIQINFCYSSNPSGQQPAVHALRWKKSIRKAKFPRDLSQSRWMI